MTRRERIADWISGGALSEARAKQATYMKAAASMHSLFENSRDDRDVITVRINAAIDEIARQKAPNATVRRIGRILRGEQV